VLEDCIAHDCVRDYHRRSGDRLDQAIDELAQRLPTALFPDSDPRKPTPNCAAQATITPPEGNYLNEKIRRADIAILDAARQADVSAIDVSAALKDGELTCSGTQYLNHANPQLKVLSGSFHPNASGQEKLASAVAAALANLGP
jgi:lysophospholipase L1-like esterase